MNMLYDEIEENNTNPIKNLFHFKDTFHLDHDFKTVFYLEFFQRIENYFDRCVLFLDKKIRLNLPLLIIQFKIDKTNLTLD